MSLRVEKVLGIEKGLHLPIYPRLTANPATAIPCPRRKSRGVHAEPRRVPRHGPAWACFVLRFCFNRFVSVHLRPARLSGAFRLFTTVPVFMVIAASGIKTTVFNAFAD
ncbi:hypothetical protein L1S32_00075 [Methanogenium sp. S4BF]|uniref:hypothetical protein n=1 Tax=Methanogenium sp. S4BF TaxID=1789226 RepID=UPI0024180196|nr:hypothetical protein [Methanogenium sp. S4BF]WFN34553.1 hypothetical protein L1S32_00075 [Methanogenium sp. S4BF]